MKETGILMTPDNHRLILSGVKTQTRRVCKLQPDSPSIVTQDENDIWGALWYSLDNRNDPTVEHFTKISNPYGLPGDRLYVKEGIIRHASIPQLIGYYLDGCRVTENWEARRTAMFMPKWAARTWLEITDVRVERLQDISEEDAVAEGLRIHENPECEIGKGRFMYTAFPGEHSRWELNAKTAYKELWDSINKKKHPWSANPFVWALSFRKI